jgi:hypothetical protein
LLPDETLVETLIVFPPTGLAVVLIVIFLFIQALLLSASSQLEKYQSKLYN